MSYKNNDIATYPNSTVFGSTEELSMIEINKIKPFEGDITKGDIGSPSEWTTTDLASENEMYSRYKKNIKIIYQGYAKPISYESYFGSNCFVLIDIFRTINSFYNMKISELDMKYIDKKLLKKFEKLNEELTIREVIGEPTKIVEILIGTYYVFSEFA